MGTLEQITKLIDAGYTKDEIAALFAQEVKEEQAPADPEPAQPAPAEPEAKQEEPDRIDAAVAKIEKLADSIAKLAIMNSQQPARESTNDFLAKIINPHYGEDK